MSERFEMKLRRVVGNVPEGTPPRARRALAQLLKMNVRSSESLQSLIIDPNTNVNLRAVACWVIGQLRDRKAVDVLLSAFGGRSVKVQWEAAKAIGLIGSKRATKTLTVTLLHTTATEKRTAAAYALGMLKDARAINPLRDILDRKNENPKLRGHAAEALSHFNKPEVIDSLLKALDDDEPEVRLWSAFALGELRAKKALPILKKLAQADHTLIPKWWTVSVEASDAIQKISSTGRV